MKLKIGVLDRQQTPFVLDKAANLPEGQFQAILSTEALDRHGEIVSIKGMDIPKDQVLKMYYNHQTSGDALPIGRWLKVWKSGGKLMGQGEVDMNDPFAVMVYKKILGGFIDSISIGFYPKEFDGDTSTWTKSTLVEASVVAEPANTEARITSKELGFTQKEFEQKWNVKLAETKPAEKMTTIQRIQKGAVMDVLVEQDKWEVMRDSDFWDVIYAFEDAFYDPNIPTSDFNKLLQETIGILQSIVDGTYSDPDDSNEEDGMDGGDMLMSDSVKAALNELKSKIGALEAAYKASKDEPAMKQLIKVRLAGKEVDKSAEQFNSTIKVHLKDLN